MFPIYKTHLALTCASAGSIWLFLKAQGKSKRRKIERKLKVPRCDIFLEWDIDFDNEL